MKMQNTHTATTRCWHILLLDVRGYPDPITRNHMVCADCHNERTRQTDPNFAAWQDKTGAKANEALRRQGE